MQDSVVISLLRGVNVVGRNKLPMEELRQLYESLGLRNPQTWLQSGNVVFSTDEKDFARLARRIEDAIEKKFGFRPSVTLRTTADLKKIIARNPFAKRRGIEPGKLLVTFLAAELSAETCEILRLKASDSEEVVFAGRELYAYFGDGMGRSELWRALDRALKKSGTGRNWNTVSKLLEMAERLESSRLPSHSSYLSEQPVPRLAPARPGAGRTRKAGACSG